jgi:electron-transferring-flavoprotein dehydrogenase
VWNLLADLYIYMCASLVVVTWPGGVGQVPAYEDAVEGSWVKEELWAVRNVHPSFHRRGPIPAQYVGMVYSGLETFVLKGRGPWTLRTTQRDSETTLAAAECEPIEYPKPDGEISFDLLCGSATC